MLGHELTLLEWNLAIGVQWRLHARRQMRAIARMTPLPRVLVLVEARGSLCDTYLAELEAATGQRWTATYQAHCALGGWDARKRTCVRADDEGVLIATCLPVVGDGRWLPFADTWHSARACAHAAVDVNGLTLHVIGAHLQAGVGPAIPHARLESVRMLREWAAAFGAPTIVGGDFNELPSSPAVASTSDGMAAAFADAWTTVGTGDGTTYPAWPLGRSAVRIDYWFVDKRAPFEVTAMDVVTSVRLSDHFPLRMTIAL